MARWRAKDVQNFQKDAQMFDKSVQACLARELANSIVFSLIGAASKDMPGGGHSLFWNYSLIIVS